MNEDKLDYVKYTNLAEEWKQTNPAVVRAIRKKIYARALWVY